jgi:hypothetical protein
LPTGHLVAGHWTGLRAENYCNEVTGGQF